MMDEKAKWEAEKEAIIAETRRKAFHDGLRTGKRIASVKTTIYLYKNSKISSVEELEKAANISLADVRFLQQRIEKNKEIDRICAKQCKKAYKKFKKEGNDKSCKKGFKKGFKRAFVKSFKKSSHKTSDRTIRVMLENNYTCEEIARVLKLRIGYVQDMAQEYNSAS